MFNFVNIIMVFAASLSHNSCDSETLSISKQVS